MNVCVVGTGYVGLVSGTCLADFGMNVICVDKDKSKIDMLNKGEIPIYELGLQDLVGRNVKLGRLSFSTDLEESINRSLVIFLAVGTPEAEDGRADLRQIHEVVKQVARSMKEYKVLVVKSTVPVGTAAELRKIVKENLTEDIEFDIVSNPEFLREGAAVNDFLRPDRIVLGCDSERALAIMRDIYRPVYLLKKPIVCTSNETAEMIKYAANTMLAMKISFINEVANLCDIVKADVYDVAVAIGMDKRIGPKFLHPGPGYGGSCFPKDVKSLVNIARDNGYTFKLAEAVVEVNDLQRQMVVSKARQTLKSFEGKTISILGLAFKPNTDDIRESPAIHIAEALIAEGATVKAYDPAAMDGARKEVPKLICCRDLYDAAEQSDLLIVVTEWNEFRELDLDRIKNSMNTPILFDTRNIYDPEQVKAAQFKYISTGRGDSE
ncbi:MAG: UDP-glucose/GDP-mannose dehydrogenase family protein [candidate division Zixibacteria bacterium]